MSLTKEPQPSPNSDPLKNKELFENPYLEEISKLSKQDFMTDWEERDKFITWITVLSTGAIVFATNLLVSHSELLSSFLWLEISAGLLLTSIFFTIVYKWLWNVKYAFDKLDLQIIGRLYESAEARSKVEEKMKRGLPPGRKLEEELERLLREEEDLFKSEGAIRKKIKKTINWQVNLKDWVYKMSLGCFMIGIAILMTSVFSSLHHHYVARTAQSSSRALSK